MRSERSLGVSDCRRFMALSREPVPPNNALLTYKTSIVFSLAEGAHLCAMSWPRLLIALVLKLLTRASNLSCRTRHALQGALLLCPARHRLDKN